MKARAQVQLGGVGGRSVPHKAKHDEISAGTYTYVKIKSESNKHEMILQERTREHTFRHKMKARAQV
jgi:hypothetical protein